MKQKLSISPHDLARLKWREAAGRTQYSPTGDKGRVVFTCHSHDCKYEEIMEALGSGNSRQSTKGDPLQQKIVELLEQGGAIPLRDVQRKLTITREVAEKAVAGLTGLVELIDPPRGKRSPLLRLKSSRSGE